MKSVIVHVHALFFTDASSNSNWSWSDHEYFEYIAQRQLFARILYLLFSVIISLSLNLYFQHKHNYDRWAIHMQNKNNEPVKLNSDLLHECELYMKWLTFRRQFPWNFSLITVLEANPFRE